MVFCDETAVQFLRQNHIDHSERYSLFLMPITASALFLSSKRHYALQHRCANARTHSIWSRFCSHFITNFHSKQFHWIDLISELVAGAIVSGLFKELSLFVTRQRRWLGHWQSQAQQAWPQMRDGISRFERKQMRKQIWSFIQLGRCAENWKVNIREWFPINFVGEIFAKWFWHRFHV